MWNLCEVVGVSRVNKSTRASILVPLFGNTFLSPYLLGSGSAEKGQKSRDLKVFLLLHSQTVHHSHPRQNTPGQNYYLIPLTDGPNFRLLKFSKAFRRAHRKQK